MCHHLTAMIIYRSENRMNEYIHTLYFKTLGYSDVMSRYCTSLVQPGSSLQYSKKHSVRPPRSACRGCSLSIIVSFSTKALILDVSLFIRRHSHSQIEHTYSMKKKEQIKEKNGVLGAYSIITSNLQQFFFIYLVPPLYEKIFLSFPSTPQFTICHAVTPIHCIR